MVAITIVTKVVFSHRDIELPGSQVGIDAFSNLLIRAIAGILVPPNTIVFTGSDCRPGGKVVQPDHSLRRISLAICKLRLLH